MLVVLQAHGIKEILTDYELKIYYSKYFHSEVITDLQERLQDQYHKSCGHTNFDSVHGIVLKADSVEKIAEKTIGLRDAIEARERSFKQHRGLLQKFKKDLTDKQCGIIDWYFYEQYHNEYIISDPVIDLMKDLLYVDEQEARSEREKDRFKKEYKETLNKAQDTRGGGNYGSDKRRNGHARGTFGGVPGNSRTQ